MSDQNVSEEVLDNLPEQPPELIEAVESAKEAIKSFDDLWKNLAYQHREKYAEYASLQESLSSMNFDRAETRVDFTKLNNLRDEIVKLEGGLETLNLYRVFVLGEEAEPWVQSEIEEKKKKIKVRTNSPNSKKGIDYSKYTEWEGDQGKTDNELNKTV